MHPLFVLSRCSSLPCFTLQAVEDQRSESVMCLLCKPEDLSSDVQSLKKKKARLCLWSHPERVETKADRSLNLSWISELQVQGELLSQQIKMMSNEEEWPEAALCPSHTHVCPHPLQEVCPPHMRYVHTPKLQIQISGDLVYMLWKIR